MKKLMLLVFLSVGLLLGCTTDNVQTLSSGSSLWKSLTVDGRHWRNYQIIYVENMPCLITDTTYPAITCDWSKWQGN